MKHLNSLLLLFLALPLIGIGQTKTVLIEEGTGTWCQWCPRGIVYGHQMQHDYDALVVAIHSNDPMDNTPAYFSAANLNGLPSGNIDRTINGQNPVNWQNGVVSQLATTPPVDITVTTSFNSSTRLLTMTVTADFFQALNGDYRLGAIVVEDGVTGNSPAWDQSNQYSGGGNGPMGGWENKPNPVPAALMVYNHVARHLATDYEGDVGSLPAAINNGDQHSYTVSWTLPADHDEEYVYVIGYITNASTGEVLNAGRSTYIPGNSNAQPFFVSNPQINGIDGVPYQYDILTHDPDNDTLTITAVGALPSWLNLNTTGPFEASLTGTPTQGNYPVTLEITDGNSTRQQSFTINVSSPTGEDWHFLGSTHITGSAGQSSLTFSNQNIPYLIYTDNNDFVYVMKYENATWQTLGNPISGSQFYAAIDIGPNGIPFIATRNNGIKVYQFENNTWSQVGSTIPDGVSLDIAIAPDGNPYVSYMDINMNSRGICKKWDGTNWVTVGPGHFTSTLPAVWTKIDFDDNGVPHILFATGAGNGAFYSQVIAFDGNSWNNLGSGNINAANATWFNHSLAIKNNKIYVGMISGASQVLDVFEYTNSAWTQIGSDIVNGAADYVSIAIDDQDLPVVGFRDETNGGKTTVLSYDGSNWDPIGLMGFTNIASRHSLAFSQSGTPYIAYIDEANSEKISVKRYGIEFPLAITSPKHNLMDFALYPNPNRGVFTIEYSYGSQYELLNIQGKIITSGQLIGSDTSIKSQVFDFSNQRPGLYFIRISYQNQQVLKKVLIH